jgi:hypothetical protein
MPRLVYPLHRDGQGCPAWLGLVTRFARRPVLPRPPGASSPSVFLDCQGIRGQEAIVTENSVTSQRD